MGIVLGKAGRNRWLGRRPHVRGTAMNPIDHPHGGGEGRTKGGRHPVSPHRQVGQGRHDAQAPQAVEQGDRPPPSQSRRYGVQKLSNRNNAHSRAIWSSNTDRLKTGG